VKVAAAGAVGLRLRWWRYGAGAAAHEEAAAARGRWTRAEWERWQAERLEEIRDAALATRWYRSWFADHPALDPRASADWPVLTKADVRAAGRDLLAGRGLRYRDHTSGTTGSPLTVWSSRPALQRWFALHEVRARREHGVSRRDRWAILGGQVVTPASRHRPPYWVWNPVGRQLYLSSGHLAEHTVASYLEALARHRPTHLVAYPSSAALLARLVLAAGLEAPDLRVVIANAEPVTPAARADIEAVFAAPVRETYGMAEMVGGASECGAGRLHWWPDAGIVEVLDDDDQPVPDSREGRLVLTGLVNEAMPLVRYEIGDRGRRPVWQDCACGSGLPWLPPVQGRSQDMIRTPDGRQVFWLNPVFYELPVHESQIVQDRLDAVRVLVVPAPGYDEATEAVIIERLRDRLGSVAISVERRQVLERGPTGKLQPVISRL
jgi:phenylacetate-CoA ligase